MKSSFLAWCSERLSPQSTLNSASSVKKWIPSIKNEIEYYLQVSQMSLWILVGTFLASNGLETWPSASICWHQLFLFPCQQSQLTHYPERKIAEFQLHIDALEKEYKRFIAKLRVLDPSCKHKPWTPRAYSKRRADTLDSTSIGQCVYIVKLSCQSVEANL